MCHKSWLYSLTCIYLQFSNNFIWCKPQSATRINTYKQNKLGFSFEFTFRTLHKRVGKCYLHSLRSQTIFCPLCLSSEFQGSGSVNDENNNFYLRILTVCLLPFWAPKENESDFWEMGSLRKVHMCNIFSSNVSHHLHLSSWVYLLFYVLYCMCSSLLFYLYRQRWWEVQVTFHGAKL